MKDLRLRNDRSRIRQGLVKSELKKLNYLDETIIYSIVYFFLLNYFKWESNFKRIAPKFSAKISKEDLKDYLEKSKIRILYDSDQYVKMLFKMDAKIIKNNEAEIPEAIIKK